MLDLESLEQFFTKSRNYSLIKCRIEGVIDDQ